MEAYTDSIEAAQNRITTAIEQWALFFDSSDWIKGFYDAISFTIRNMWKLGGIFLALAGAMNFTKVINTFTGGLTDLSTKFASFSLLTQKMMNSMKNNPGGIVEGAKSSFFTMLDENYLVSQQKMFSQSLARYTSSLDAVTAQNMLNVQNMALGLQAEDKLTLSKILLGEITDDQIQNALSSINVDQRQILIDTILATLSEQERQAKLESIKATNGGNEAEAKLTLATQRLAEIRNTAYGKSMGKSLDASANMPTAGQAAFIGAGSMVGMIRGGVIGGNIGSSLAGDNGTLIGSLLGGSLGSYAAKSLSTGIATIASSGLKAGISAALPGIGALIPLIIGGIWSYVKNKQQEAIEEAAEEYTEAIEKLQNYQNATTKVSTYDELVKGVDSLGRNISLTTEEYDEFLSVSNELAEIYPELVVRTDDLGNSFLGMNGKVTGVKDSVDELVEAMKHLANQKLLDEDLFESEYQKVQKEYYKNKNQKENLASIFNYDLESGSQIQGDFNTLKTILEEYNKLYGTSYSATYGNNGIGATIIKEEDLINFNTFLKNYLSQQKNILESGYSEILGELDAERKAIVEEDSKLYSQLEDMSEESQEFVKNLYSGVGYEGNENDFINNVKETTQAAIDFINDNPVYLDFLYDYTGNMSGTEYQKMSAEFIEELKKYFPGLTTDELNNILFKFGFTYDPNLNKISSDSDILGTIINEGLDRKLAPDAQAQLGLYSIDDLSYIYKILKSISETDINTDTLNSLLFNLKYSEAGLSQLSKYYTEFTEKLNETGLTETEEQQYEIIKRTMDLWANQLGVIKGEYDTIVEKASYIGDLTYGGTSELTPEQVQEKYQDYSDIYNYLNSDYSGAWDIDKMNLVLSNQELLPYIGDPDLMKEKLKEFLDDGERLYRNSVEQVLIATEEGSQYILETKADEVKQFAEDYNIDLTNFTDLKTAEATINQYTTSLLTGDYATWVSKMLEFYAQDLENFTTIAGKKMALNKMLIDQMGFTESEQAAITHYEVTLANSQEGYTTEEVEDMVSQKIFSMYRNKNQQNIKDYVDSITADLQSIIDTDFQISGLYDSDLGSGSSDADDALTTLEKLQKYRELIDKEWEAMEVYDEKTKTYTYTEYFTKMRAALNAEIQETLRLMNAGNLTEEEYLDYEADLIELQKELNNLDDEEREDQISLLETKEASIQAMIEQQKLYIETADTEEELIQRQKEMNDLVEEELDMRRELRSFMRDVNDFKLEYLSGTAYSNGKQYDALLQESINSYKEDAKQAAQEIETAIAQAYNQYVTEVDAQGNRLYTDSQAKELAQQTEKVQTLTKEYMEAIQGQAEMIIQGVNDKLAEIEQNIDDLEKSKPKEWSSIDQIKEFSESTMAELEKKIPVLQEALSDTSMMTDEQVQDLINQLNDVTVALHEAQIEMREDIKAYQDSQYDAIVSKVEEYKEEIQDLMNEIEEAYDDEIGQLEDANKERERAIELTDLLTARENAAAEKKRVYREGIGYVYESDRQKIKEADEDLRNFRDQDQIDDLEATRDKELEILQERIEAWDLYLEALDWKYTEYDRIERDRLLKELLNVETEEEIRDRITNDMLEFNSTCEGSYKNYIGIFTNFLDEYEENLERLAELQRKQLEILSSLNQLNTNDQMQNITNSPTSEGGSEKLPDGLHYKENSSMAWIPGVGNVAVDIENGHTITEGLPVGTIISPNGTSQKWEITGVNSDGSYQSRPVTSSGSSSSSSSSSSSGGLSSSSSSSSSSNSSNGGYSFLDKVNEVNASIGQPGSNLYWKSYSSGLENGPVTYTGLAMLHGSAESPEYVLNNDQAYNLLSYLTNKPLDYEKVVDNSKGISYIIQGDVILEDVENPVDFWNEVTKAMGNRWSVTKNK